LNASTPNIDTADSEWLISHVIAPIDGSNINDLLQMHDSKDSQLTIREARRRVLMHIRAKDFVIHFQSIAALSDTSTTLFFEALARWAGKNPMSPPEFLAHAFAMGLGNHMTLLLFDTFCQALEQTIRKTPNLTSKFSFNIHLSVFVDPTMRQALVDIVHQYNLKPSLIIFELIEIENTTRFEELNDAIRHYEALGFSFAIDDFGSSFSSIQRLASFKFHYLKLDASITRALRDTNIQIVIRNIAELAVDWGVPLIAEGIETKEQKARLETLGVHWGQGYLMSRPAPMHSGKRGPAL
jgi:EAL domain-containing protein (putative c-di-GMP-specific phosphodiesterase class I)